MKANHNGEHPIYRDDWLLQISVVQRMKANHNKKMKDTITPKVVANISCSKNESKSQLMPISKTVLLSCCKYQLFKEWKQITTGQYQRNNTLALLQISVVQRMKANHNGNHTFAPGGPVVANISCSKNESKSQPKYWNNGRFYCCCKYQLFKEWKQITTICLLLRGLPMLLQISVVQRMKANHNCCSCACNSHCVVANISCSKNESKSQLDAQFPDDFRSCCKYQLFKEWKQITTAIWKYIR